MCVYVERERCVYLYMYICIHVCLPVTSHAGAGRSDVKI